MVIIFDKYLTLTFSLYERYKDIQVGVNFFFTNDCKNYLNTKNGQEFF